MSDSHSVMYSTIICNNILIYLRVDRNGFPFALCVCARAPVGQDGGVATHPLTAALRTQIMQLVTQYATGRDTLRCLALAAVDAPPARDTLDLEDSRRFAMYESGMTLVGVVGMLDPPRVEVKDAIAKCRLAGIRVIVITGASRRVHPMIELPAHLKVKLETACFSCMKFTHYYMM